MHEPNNGRDDAEATPAPKGRGEDRHMSGAFYNENDPKAAAWLRELIKQGHIAPGIVDERSIVEIKPHELDGYTQCHFFAGIGGWSYALRLAAISDETRIWTGSCPCQPLSCAGQRKGHADERHLWPAFYRLIAECHPAIVFGEQVASPDGLEWFAGIRADLEGAGYAVGGADLCAAGVAAPHSRQRIYWMADGTGRRWRQGCKDGRGSGEGGGEAEERSRLTDRRIDGGMADSNGRMGDTERERLEGFSGHGENRHEPGRNGMLEKRSVASDGFWSNFDLCHFTGADAGKTRRVEAGTFPLAHGVSERVELLRGYGNAIVPQVAAKFIQASLEAIAP